MYLGLHENPLCVTYSTIHIKPIVTARFIIEAERDATTCAAISIYYVSAHGNYGHLNMIIIIMIRPRFKVKCV